MTLRRLLNVSYELLAEGRDEAELAKLDAELQGDGSPAWSKRQRNAIEALDSALALDAG